MFNRFRKAFVSLAAVLFFGAAAFATNLALDGNLSVGGTATITGATTQTGMVTLTKVATTGTIPTIGTCGTSPAITTGSTQFAGKFTMGTSASNACVVTFAAAYTTAPFCVVQNATTGAGAFTMSVSTTAITIGGTAADSSVFFYTCIAPSGG